MTEQKPPAAVVGAGLMGVGVAQCLATGGHRVTVVESSPEARSTAPKRLKEGLRLVALRGPERPDFGRVVAGITWTDDWDALHDAAFVVECVTERPHVKDEVFRRLDEICPRTAILASCTSAIPVARLAAATSRPGSVLATHFMNPAPIKTAVEVARGALTSEETLRRTLDLLTGLGKSPIVVADAPGFVTNRVLMLTINEAAAVVHEGTAAPETVDQIFRDCFGHPTGPLATADLIGLDTVVDTLDFLLDHMGDPRFRPSPLLTELVRQGRTGRKRKEGFYSYRT